MNNEELTLNEKDNLHYKKIAEMHIKLKEEAIDRATELEKKIVVDDKKNIQIKRTEDKIDIIRNGESIGGVSFSPKLEIDTTIWENPKYKFKDWRINLSFRPKLFWHIPMTHIDMIKDKEFKEKWNNIKKELIKNQNNKCFLCNQGFSKSDYAVLHHKNSEDKKKEYYIYENNIYNEIIKSKISLEEGIRRIEKKYQEYEPYYKSLSDVQLICKKCHSEQHKEMIEQMGFMNGGRVYFQH